jgi:hypothetical protein
MTKLGENSLEKTILYDYWESVPKAESLDIRNYESHPIRSTVLRILYDGLFGQILREKQKKRHVLNASEILDELNKRIETGRIIGSKKGKSVPITKPVSITNLYFHLNKLIDNGLIVVVTELLEGPHKRNKTKYYGRVAKQLFITDEEESLQMYKRRFDAFERIAKVLGLPLPEDYADFPNRYLTLKKARYKAIENWVVKNERAIYDMSQENQDFGDVYEFLKMMDSHFSNKYEELSSSFIELIQSELK